MLLKSLQMSGFKSFPDKRILNFEKGITAVVGPNGSGKSNVSDAVRWVFGEQATRVLRVKNMEDIIFNGTVDRKPMGMAEVILVIDNRDRGLNIDSDEVAVCRRYYRSGNSEYKINGNTVRLKDVLELFMDTGMGRGGYSIIGQGKVSEIVDAKATDRRAVFEEAAGIAKYRARKNEAERNLAKTEENLTYLNVIMTDLEERVGPLEKEAEKAKKYNLLYEEKKSCEIGLWLSQITSLNNLLRDQDYRLTLLTTQQNEATDEIEALEAEIAELDENRNKLLARKDMAMREAAGLEEQAAQLEGEALVIDNDISHGKNDIERLRGEIADAEEGGKRLLAEIGQKKALIEEKKKQIAVCEQTMSEVAGQIEGLYKKETGENEQLSALREKQSRNTVALADLRAQNASAKQRLDELSERRNSNELEKTRCRVEIEKAKKEKELSEKAIEKVKNKIEELSNSIVGYRMRLEKNRAKCAEIKDKHDRLLAGADDARRHAKIISDLEKNLEGYVHSVRVVMQRTREGVLRGIHGPVSNIIETPSEYAVAIETTLGQAIQHIVVDDEEAAKAGIRYLQKSGGGRATFLPITTIKPRRIREQGLEKNEGYVGIASELVRFDEKYRSIVENLLGNVLIVEDIDCAVAIARRYSYAFRIVTLDGQVVNAGGSMTGGSQAKNAGILSRRSELEKLENRAKELTAQAKDEETVLREATKLAAGDEASLLAVQSEQQTAREDLLRFEADLRLENQLIEAGESRLAQIEQDEQRQTDIKERLGEEIKAQEKKIAELSEEEKLLEESVSELSGSMDALSRERAGLSESLNSAGLERLSLQKECEAQTEAIAELESRTKNDSGRKQELSAQIKRLLADIGDSEEKAASLREVAAGKREKSSSIKENIKEIENQRDALEMKVQEKRRESRDASSRREGMTGELERLREKSAHTQRDYDNIILKLQEEYSLTRRQAEEIYEPAPDERAAFRKVTELRSKIRALGSVNLGAIEEFAEVSEKYNIYKTQMTDIEKSRDELFKLIEQLTGDMKTVFAENFARINTHFGEIFPELFGGGKAKLELTDPEDSLNSGIEIEITAPGKAPQSNTESFSGGEKSIIAVAIYFAIMKVNPSPFCVLDEVDSALDENNVVNIARYIERMCDTTQYIVITHRRGTMEVARTLYGITKREGVSRMLELNIGEIEEKLGKLD